MFRQTELTVTCTICECLSRYKSEWSRDEIQQSPKALIENLGFDHMATRFISPKTSKNSIIFVKFPFETNLLIWLNWLSW